MPITRCLIVALTVLFTGCKTQQAIVGGVFTNPQKSYKITLPKGGWILLRQGLGEDVTMHNAGSGGATIAVVSHQQKYTDLSLDILQAHLFIGIEHRRVLEKQFVTLSNQTALHAVLLGEVNGDEIKISSYVVAKDGWVYDLVYWTGPDHFDKAAGDFEEMVKSFVFIDKQGKK